jgi:DNA-binding protein Fis
VVLSHGQGIQFDLMVPHAQERRVRPARSRGSDLEGLIQQLVTTALQTIPADAGNLHKQLVDGVERELLAQVLPLCDNVLVKAAARLGINRNTLHKKLSEFQPPSEKTVQE